MILRDFECPSCVKVFEELVSNVSRETNCPSCGSLSSRIFVGSPTPIGCDSFNPHYDMQLGQHFSSAKDKKQYLERTGKVQESGHLSPRQSRKGRILCSKSQFKRMEVMGGVERYI